LAKRQASAHESVRFLEQEIRRSGVITLGTPGSPELLVSCLSDKRKALTVY
jgi:hypothetical protein